MASAADVGWFRGRERVDHSNLTEHLRVSGVWHAAQAFRLMGRLNTSYDVVQAAVHAGTAVELLTKMTLAEIDPILLAAPPKSTDSLLAEVARYHGKGLDESVELGQMFTVDASVAVATAAKVYKDLGRPAVEAARKVLAARNSAVHMGFGSDASSSEAIEEMVAYLEHLAEVTQKDAQLFWVFPNEGYDSMADIQRVIQRAREARRKRLLRAAVTKIDEAAKWFSRLGERGQQARRDEARGKGPSFSYEMKDDPELWARPVLCPACGSEAWSRESIIYEPPSHSDPDHDSPFISSVAEALECPVCRLKLGVADLEGIENDKHQPQEDKTRRAHVSGFHG